MENLRMKDVIKNISSRFDLILTAAKRARQIQIADKEKMLLNMHYQHKCTILALNEIEENLRSKNQLISNNK